jgi:hypothetical protein
MQTGQTAFAIDLNTPNSKHYKLRRHSTFSLDNLFFFMPVISSLSAARYVSLLFSLQLLLGVSEALAPYLESWFRPGRGLMSQDTTFSSITIRSSASDSVTEQNPLDELSDERKANLFQFLLRDLEVEQVPVLGVDAEETHVFQAALWTTMGELSENDLEDRVCLVFESIPVEKLKTFVNEFDAIKANATMIKQLPELRRFNVSLVGKGVGPAIVMSTYNRTNVEKELYQSMKRSALNPDQIRWSAAMKAFVTRTSPNLDPGIFACRIIGSTDICDIMSGYWTSICELLSLSEGDHKASIILSYPPIIQEEEIDRLGRYTAVSLLISRMDALFGDDDLGYLHVFPLYDRDAITGPNEETVPGHLPSSSKTNDQGLSAWQSSSHNYGRRSPLPGVIIQRHDELWKFDKQAELYPQNLSKEELEAAVKIEAEIVTTFE